MISVSSAWPVRALAAPAHRAGSLSASMVWRHQPVIFKKSAKVHQLAKPSKTACPPKRRLVLPSAAGLRLSSSTSVRPPRVHSCSLRFWRRGVRPLICLLSSSLAGLLPCKAGVLCAGVLASAAFHGRSVGSWRCSMSRWWSSAWRVVIRLCRLAVSVVATAWWHPRSRFQRRRPTPTLWRKPV